LRAHTQTSGWSLAAQDVFNNVARTTIEAMAAVSGHTQSLHTNSLDEALALPTDFSARIARNTQLFLQIESGLTRVIDPWGGSHYVERLTHDLAARALSHIAEVEAAGGMAKAIAKGLPKRRIEAAAALEALEAGARGKANLLELAVAAGRAKATVGEISLALEKVFGRHQAKPEVVRGVYGASVGSGAKVTRARSMIAAFAEAEGRRPSWWPRWARTAMTAARR
jgi:methylmalonyl-CoA mutase